MSRRFDGRNVFWSVFIGVLLVQGAWILILPTFRGIDEFDHVYKAAAVARGEWTNHGVAENGRGAYVTIPGSIVRAAEAVCDFYEYTGPDNCRAARTFPGDEVDVATAASNYNPVYYMVVGTASRPFSGDGVVYAIRIVGAVLCALMIAWAAALTSRWARTAWPLVAFAVGFTPVFLYSTSIASPNGMTYAGATLVWCAVLAASRSDAYTRNLALPLAVGAVTMVTTHTTGALWLALIGLAAIALAPFTRWLNMLRQDLGPWSGAALAVVAASGFAVLWVRTNNTNALGPRLPGADTDPLTLVDLLNAHLLWIFQAVAAFPTLNEQAPPVVYATWLLLLVGVLVQVVRKARRGGRLIVAMLVILFFALTVPTALTVISYAHEGLAWQGRYTLPMWIGFALLAGALLEESHLRLRRTTVIATFGLMAIAMVVSTVNLGLVEVDRGPSDPAAAALPGGFFVVGVLAAAGVLLPLVTLSRSSAETGAGRVGKSSDR